KLIEQLKEGGRMVLPVGTNRQELKLVIKDNEGIKVEKIISVRFVPMVRDALD
ncbi:MAG TPA: protein-L-isoaspartate O-methyltransferase, partial [Candidatus Omnitrophica bacterium]|nr:protein-L-isoaspartate O-methyltransferase [Candidatus Omnitrophota bacterium]